jgi:hypothetical protein
MSFTIASLVKKGIEQRFSFKNINVVGGVETVNTPALGPCDVGTSGKKAKEGADSAYRTIDACAMIDVKSHS